MARPDIDLALLVQDYPAPGLDESQIYYRNDALAFARAAGARNIPAAICATLPENLDPETRDLLISWGISPMQGIHETLDAVHAAGQWSEARAGILSDPPAPLVAPGAGTLAACDEAEGKAWLAGLGFAVPRGCLMTAEDLSAAGTLNFPLALKMMSPELQHKTEAGAVVLNLPDGAALATAMQDMQAAVQAHNPDAVTDRFLVEEMQPKPLAELIIGIRCDPQFGLAMTLGSGGILVELIGDATTLLLPASPRVIRAALERIRATKLLRGFRGAPAADLDALAAQLHALATAVVDQRDVIGELEINPLFVYENHCVAADVLLHRNVAG